MMSQLNRHSVTGGTLSSGLASRVPRRLDPEGGFTLIEVLIASVVLVVGLLSLLGLVDVANKTTAGNRARQTGTSLARDAIENARSLAYRQLTQSAIAAALQPLVAGSSVSGSNLTVPRAPFTYTVSFKVCSMDDPVDGIGDHSSPPTSGGAWCPDVAASGTTDSEPDDYKRLTVTATPGAPYASRAVQQTVLIASNGVNGPSVSCLSTTSSCPGTDETVTTGASPQNPSATPAGITFNVTTSVRASSVQWMVNGSPPSSADVPTGALDPYTPAGTSSSFVWNTASLPDGLYQISAIAHDANGNSGTTETLQISLNRQQATPPASVKAGWNGAINGVDVQWVPSVDGDILYYRVFSQVGTNAPTQVCQTLASTPSCSDLTAPAPPAPPTCSDAGESYTTPNDYWVVGVDTDPNTGQPRQSTILSRRVDANLCDHPPNRPPSLSGTPPSNGSITLNWTVPTPLDPDSWDTISDWRIYRWPTGGAITRYQFIGATDSAGSWVVNYVDQAPDPNGVPQNYCVTAVDSHLQESGCSATWTG
jgi:prepilin-type N-terminal cleavage/methylation domain-containing protein